MPYAISWNHLDFPLVHKNIDHFFPVTHADNTTNSVIFKSVELVCIVEEEKHNM